VRRRTDYFSHLSKMVPVKCTNLCIIILLLEADCLELKHLVGKSEIKPYIVLTVLVFMCTDIEFTSSEEKLHSVASHTTG
jgi:hypothetical protein